LQVTASFGGTFAIPAIDALSEGLIRAADTALYRAKREGRDCVRVIRYESETNPQLELTEHLVGVSKT
jgi:PleD family two-component response regulator